MKTQEQATKSLKIGQSVKVVKRTEKDWQILVRGVITAFTSKAKTANEPLFAKVEGKSSNEHQWLVREYFPIQSNCVVVLPLEYQKC